ncbi:MAG: FAD-dependent oxidoreductase, partial [Steroidobacteraceae bacterium]
YRYGRVLRRDFLDTLLVDHAVAQGVHLLQPARVRSVKGAPGAYECVVESERSAQSRMLCAAVVIDAHGSWQRGPQVLPTAPQAMGRPKRASDLFAFKAVFEDSSLQPGLLPVISMAGGYGGMVVADHGLATLACCVRRDTLAEWRKQQARWPAGDAVEALLRAQCTGVRRALDGARRVGPWLTVGPLQPGRRLASEDSVFRIGNAAGESHPLIGEGISMALQSAALLAKELTRHSPAAHSAHAREVQRHYVSGWRQAFSHRLRMAALYAHIAMRPALATPARAMLGQWPAMMTMAARLAGKARALTPVPLSGATT